MKGDVSKMELKDTVDLMLSEDYIDRFKAEYYQLKIRFEKLEAMLDKWNANELDFTPTCPRDVLEQQLDQMYNYMKTLELRAQNEHIAL